MGGRKLPQKSDLTDVTAFLDAVSNTPIIPASNKPGRLIFALDATASRESTWDHACRLQSEMFKETASLGGLEIQLAYFRGFGEFRVSSWSNDSNSLLRQMTSVFCLAGETQIKKILDHTIKETNSEKVNAVVFIGDCIEEDIDELGSLAGKLGLLGVPVFIFQEGYDEVAEFAFKQIAKLSNGAFCRLDEFSAKNLQELLQAVAVFAAGGYVALDKLAKKRGGTILRIAKQVESE